MPTLFRKFLYSSMGPAVIFILLLLGAAAQPSLAQGRPQLKRPEDIPQEKPPETKKKPAKGTQPRAVGLLQLNSSGKATLIPIVIRIDGKFYDASVYKADPVPMALESGTVYEAEQAGDSQGLFTVAGALHSKNPGSANLWVGTGSYLPRGAEVASTTHKAEDVPVGLGNSDEPPRLTRGDASKAAATPTSTAPSSTSTTTPAAGSGAAAPDSQSSPPSAASAPSASTPAGTPSGQETNKSTSPATPDKSADAKGQTSEGMHKSSDHTTQPTSSSSSSASDGSNSQPAENYYRPALRRGKPTEAAPEEQETAPKAVKAVTAGKSNAVIGEPIQLVPAISDAAGPDPKSYKFFWKTGEEQERRDQMLALAGDEVRAYARALVRNQIPAKPLAAKAPVAGRKSAAKPEQPLFENLQFRTYDVWMNNQPVMVLSAEAHFVPAPGAAVGAADQTFSIALVAKTDIYGNLHKLYSGVTDKFHLDVTPRLELIDVVDVDGDGRGELLFHETTDAGSGYVIYRATADKLWKMFDNLNAE
jgi:hypothetical protein